MGAIGCMWLESLVGGGPGKARNYKYIAEKGFEFGLGRVGNRNG